MQPESKNIRDFEKLLLVFLMVLTVSLFSFWGYEAVIHILSTMFDVPTESSIFSVFVGVIGMIGGVFAFAGSIFWWNGKAQAKNLIVLGGLMFVVKNIFDIINAVVVFGNSNAGGQISSWQIQELAQGIGLQLFHVAFWVFTIVFFSMRAKKLAERAGGTSLN